MTKRQAIREMRAVANALIEQAERRAKGFDKGMHRDDEPYPSPSNTIAARERMFSRYAFNLSKTFA